ncbi:neuronal acetylcholine receptor subunit alpha-5-like [Convolutriloba macropyga]|uniref:neuronal acetylcholine receptor subunit alpha-5-like n=1 Tax=Convolutriloba macropyga TaxID=536237 RepID=UPI003F51CE5A
MNLVPNYNRDFITLAFALTLLACCSLFVAAEDEIANSGVELEQKLLKQLKSKVPQLIPPMDMVNNMVNVKIDIYQIVDIDEKDGLWTAKLYLYLFYDTPSARWNREDYGGIELITVPKDTFWSPDLTIQSSVRVNYDAYDKQTVWSSGNIVARSTVFSAQLSCEFNVKYFPFDTQTCIIEIVPMIMHTGIYNASIDEEISGRYLQENDQWEIVYPITTKVIQDTYLNSNDLHFTNLQVHVKLVRRPRYYQVVLVFPIVTIYTFSMLTFAVPPESGEKVGFAVTFLLAEIVAFATLSEVLPESSIDFPIILYFVSIVTLHMCFLCLVAVFVVSVHLNSHDLTMRPIYRRIIQSHRLIYIGIKPYKCLQSRSKPELNEAEFSETDVDEMGTNLNNARVNLNSVKTIVEKCEEISSKSASMAENEQDLEKMWKILAAVADRIFFFVHFAIVVFNMVRLRAQFYLHD